ncbi:O-antigen ligase family protein [Corallibacter sp.]|uniref:O-antigen ligase family protein n=1 Tax=Corallibacter sp. TaxID=2038084 RepID=UPI003AB63874
MTISLSKIYNYVFILLCVSLPYENLVSALPNILLFLLGFLSLFLIKKEDIVSAFKKEKVFLSYVLIVVIIFLFSLIHGEIKKDIIFLGKLLIPLVFIIISLPIKNFDNLKKIFILSVFVAVVLSFFNIINHIINSGNFKFSKGNFINDILISERLYMGFYCVISLICSLDLIQSSTKLKKLFVFNVIILTSFLFFITARIAIMSSALVLVYFIVYKLNKKQRVFFGILFFALTSLFFILNKNLTKRFFHLDDVYNNGLLKKIKIHEPRYDIWKCSLEILSEENTLFLGNGYTHTKELLVACYKDNIKIQKRQDWFVERKFNTHNQFLDFLLSYGFIGLILLLVLFLLLFSRGKNTFLVNSLLGALILIMFVENIFHRQLGCYLFSLIFVIILNIDKSWKHNLEQ